MAKSLIEIAFEIQSSRSEPTSFEVLWDLVKKEAGLDDDTAKAKVARFYTNLMLDGRFANLGDNTWDLRIRHKFEQTHHDVNDAYTDVDTRDDDEEEEEENKEYDKLMAGEETSESLDEEEKENEGEEENF